MSIILHTRRSLVSASKRINSLGIGNDPPTIVKGELSGSAVTGTVTMPSSTTSIKVYGCAGGGTGNTGVANQLTGAQGGSGGSAQLNGYTIPVTSGEVLSYSVGSYDQATSITRQGNTIFTLAAGSSAGTAVPAGTYGSHGGGAGGAGGARFNPGSPAPLGTLIGGGGGGGGYGDTSPIVAGGRGGDGGAGNSVISITVTINNESVQFLSANAGVGTMNAHGGNVFGAYGGATAGNTPYTGGGGGAGAGIKVSTFTPATTAYGGGGGGGGAAGTPNQVPGGGGGAGFLIIEYL